MLTTFQNHSWAATIGVGGASAFVLAVGLPAYRFTLWQYRLVLRDEMTVWGTPAPFFGAGVVLSILALWAAARAAKSFGRPLRWDGKGSRRGGPMTWDEVLLVAVPGVMLSTIAFGLFLNCALDTSQSRTHSAQILDKRKFGGPKGERSYNLILVDWQNPRRNVELTFRREVYQSHDIGDHITIQTRSGRLGYEWIVGVR